MAAATAPPPPPPPSQPQHSRPPCAAALGPTLRPPTRAHLPAAWAAPAPSSGRPQQAVLAASWQRAGCNGLGGRQLGAVRRVLRGRGRGSSGGAGRGASGRKEGCNRWVGWSRARRDEARRGGWDGGAALPPVAALPAAAGPAPACLSVKGVGPTPVLHTQRPKGITRPSCRRAGRQAGRGCCYIQSIVT